MGSKTYKTRAIVLKKTKLADKDLIVTMIDESGSLVQGVAKGARKPGGSLTARLELFSCVDVLMAKGRSLDVVCEARMAKAGGGRCSSLEQSACAAPIAELVATVAQPGLDQPRLFAMAQSALAHIAEAGRRPAEAASITAACLWKVMGQSGFRPSIARCASCGGPVALLGANDDKRYAAVRTAPFSFEDGGVVCSRCPRSPSAVRVEADTLRWCDALISMTFDEVARRGVDISTTFAVLHLAQPWIIAHTGRRLKSLDFLFTSGLF